MNSYLVRVELHGFHPNYDELHRVMANLGFGKQIFGDDGKWYDLPTAEYCGLSALSSTGVRDMVRSRIAIVASNPPACVLVTLATESAWFLKAA